MIKSKPIRVRQSEQISNIFAKRDRKQNKAAQIPKELHWLLLKRNSKTTSLLLDSKAKPKPQSERPKEIQNKEPEPYRQKTKQDLEGQSAGAQFIEPPGLLTEINLNPSTRRRRAHHAYTSSLRNDQAKQNQEMRTKKSYQNLKFRQEKLGISLQQKPSAKRPSTAFKPKSASSNKQSRTVHIQERFFGMFTTFKIESINNSKLLRRDEGSKYQSFKSWKPLTATSRICLSRKPRNRRHHSLFQNLELKPWQNMELSIYDDFNRFQ